MQVKGRYIQGWKGSAIKGTKVLICGSQPFVTPAPEGSHVSVICSQGLLVVDSSVVSPGLSSGL